MYKKERCLFIEKLALGNTKKLTKKYKFYNVSFNVVEPIINSNKNIDLNERKLELLALKEQLENMQKEKIKIR